MLGRVSSLDWLISIGLLPISFALTAPVASVIGVRATLVGAGLVGAAITLGSAVPARDARHRGERQQSPGRRCPRARRVHRALGRRTSVASRRLLIGLVERQTDRGGRETLPLCSVWC